MRIKIRPALFSLPLPGVLCFEHCQWPFIWLNWTYRRHTDRLLLDLGRGEVLIHDDAPVSMRNALLRVILA